MRLPFRKGRRAQRMCSFRGSFANRGNGTELYSSDVVRVKEFEPPASSLRAALRLAKNRSGLRNSSGFSTAAEKPGSFIRPRRRSPAFPKPSCAWFARCRRWKSRSDEKGTDRQEDGLYLFGPSEGIRTPGILVPNQARYQLRYTRFNQALCLYPRETRYSRPKPAYTIRKPRKARQRLVVQLRYTRISSEETRAIPFPQFAKELRKLHIRSFLLPLPIKPASLGFDRVPGFRNTSCSEKPNYYISPEKQKQAEKCR